MQDVEALERVRKMADGAIESAFETVWGDVKDVPPLIVELLSNFTHLAGYLDGYLEATKNEEALGS